MCADGKTIQDKNNNLNNTRVALTGSIVVHGLSIEVSNILPSLALFYQLLYALNVPLLTGQVQWGAAPVTFCTIHTSVKHIK